VVLTAFGLLSIVDSQAPPIAIEQDAQPRAITGT
jgi:hypothetical protein